MSEEKKSVPFDARMADVFRRDPSAKPQPQPQPKNSLIQSTTTNPLSPSENPEFLYASTQAIVSRPTITTEQTAKNGPVVFSSPVAAGGVDFQHRVSMAINEGIRKVSHCCRRNA